VSSPLSAREVYLRTVEQLFLLLRRQGLMLSPADLALIAAWCDRDFPLEVTCRALVEAAARYRDHHGAEAALPRSLRYFAGAVEDEVARARLRESERASEGDAVAAVDHALAELDALLERLRAAGGAEGQHAIREAYRATWRALASLRGRVARGEASGYVVALVELERRHVDAVVAALPNEARRALTDAVEARLAHEAPRLGPRGLADRRRALLESELATRYGLFRIFEESFV
jgi:hypothetical protein